MHFSIEARSPFQDERIISIARTEREEIVKDSGTKKLLRELYPELETLGIRKDKEGFISPVGHWLRGNQQLVDDSLKFLRAQRVFVPSFLDTFKNAAFEKDFRKIKQLWHLVVWAKWAQIHHSTGVA
jgi:asparagine synthetase B (glutamine-hydrolysing)